MKLKVGKKKVPLFEKKKAPAGSSFGMPTNQARPMMRPGPSMLPNQNTKQKSKNQDITKVISNLPKDELAAYVSIIIGLIFIFIAIIIW